MKAPRQSGFTLWELLVTMLVAGVLVAVGVPSFRDAQRNSAITAAANDLITGLLAARAEAVKRQVPVTLCASPDPSAAIPVCAQDGAGANGGFIVWVDWDPTHVDPQTGTPIFLASDGNAVLDPAETPNILIRTPPPLSAKDGTLKVYAATTIGGNVNSGYVSFAPSGFLRTAQGVGFGPATRVLYCDDRGVKQTFDANFSTARLVRIENTGRANVEQALQDINGADGALSQIPGAVCP
jgi:prepilin-type N-terminal cleavage/methylation domain-containing protein